MPLELPDDNQPAEKADKILVTRYEVQRSPNGVGESTLAIDLGFGKATGETDVFGNPKMDLFGQSRVVNIQISSLISELQKAVEAQKITQAEMNTKIQSLLALDAANQAGIEAFILFCQTAGLIQLPTRVLR